MKRPARGHSHIDVWVPYPYTVPMKITVEIDDKKLSHLMKLTGIRTKTRALDYALRMAERGARRDRLLETILRPEELTGAVDPAYDVLALRKKEKPSRRR